MMIKDREHLTFSGISVEKIQLLCLLFLGVVDFLMVTVSPLRPWLAEFMVQQYLVVPALLFVGAALTTRQSPEAVRMLLLGIVMVIWLALAQCAQRLAWEDPKNITMWWAAYLLAFPFAAVTGKDRGLRMMGMVAIAISVVMTLCSVLLLLDILPLFLTESVIWDNKGRLVAMGHPNISGWLFMLGIAFSLGLSFEAKNKWVRGGLLAAGGLQFLMQALTNSRTSNLMTCVLIAGAAFFWISRGGWKRMVLGAVTAAVVVVSLFLLSDAVYKQNYERLMTAQTSTQEQSQKPVAEESSSSGTGGDAQKAQLSARNSFWKDLKTFTGRTSIWKAGIQALKDHPDYLLRGTFSVGGAITEGGNSFGVMHAHNAWMEMLIGFGLPALLLALCFTFLAIRGIFRTLISRESTMMHKCVAMLTGCMLVAGILEPFLFTGYSYCHFISVMFLLCTGYLNHWQKVLKA